MATSTFRNAFTHFLGLSLLFRVHLVIESSVLVTPSCNNSLDNTKQLVMSPNFPSPYKKKEICQWVLIAECNETISLVFQEFETEILHDYVQITEDKLCRCKYDSEKLRTRSDKLHGWIYPKVYESKFNALQIYFVADCNVHYKGFKISYTAKETGNSSEQLSSDLEQTCTDQTDFNWGFENMVEKHNEIPCAAIKMSFKISALLLCTCFITAII